MIEDAEAVLAISIKKLINSINMYKMFNMLMNGQTQEVIHYLTDAVQKLESVGADFVVMCENTPHIVF